MFFLLCSMFVVINIKGTAAAATHPDWKNHARILLCNHPGSREDKATKIRDELHSDYPDYSWYVNVMESDVAWGFHRDAESASWQWVNTCGYNMFIWYKADSLTDKKTCSSKDRSEVAEIIKAADSKGLSNHEVKDKIQRLMKISGIGYHLISVDDGHSQSYSALELHHRYCLVVGSRYHDVFVYLK